MFLTLHSYISLSVGRPWCPIFLYILTQHISLGYRSAHHQNPGYDIKTRNYYGVENNLMICSKIFHLKIFTVDGAKLSTHRFQGICGLQGSLAYLRFEMLLIFH